MARRTGIEGFLRAANRAMAAAERERARQQRSSAQIQRQYERRVRMAQAQQARALKEAEKQAKQDYLEMRMQEVADLNSEVEEKLVGIRGVLAHTLDFDDTIAFPDLYPTETFPPFIVPVELRPKSAPIREPIKPQAWWQKILPGAALRLQRTIAEAESRFQQEFTAYQQGEERKHTAVAGLRSSHDAKKSAFDASIAEQVSEIDRFKSAYFAREAEAFVSYNEMVLTRSEYPTDDFTQQFRIAYDPASKILAIEYDFPLMTIVPVEAEYKYVKTRDAIDSKLRKANEVKLIYQQLLAEISLRTVHEVFEADQADGVDVVAFTGIVDTCDPATGLDIRVPVISVRTTKIDFLQINLKRADPIACLRSLGAHVSSRPDELLAVKPIVDFNMVDKRFVDQADALSDLESRSNLMEMSPTEFEVLVANLFGKMGLETKLTRSSRDGGVDAVAFDSRPVLGGKVVIQAKCYRDAVGVSAVRDLYGTMMNEGASKGILVTTGRYGPDAYSFAKDKPIELIDGSGLLYLLREQANINARIVHV